VKDWFQRLVPSAGQDVAKIRRHRGEDLPCLRALTNTANIALSLRVRCIASIGANLRHADAQECRAKVAVKV
jgi:hypothetical protein